MRKRYLSLAKAGALLAVLMLCLFCTAQAASFDCEKATTKVEKMICGDDELSKLDEELAVDYSVIFERAENQKSVKKTQLAWLKNRNKCEEVGADPFDTIRCLRYQYRKRSIELR